MPDIRPDGAVTVDEEEVGVTHDALMRAVPVTFDTPRGWRKVGRYVLLVVVALIVIFPELALWLPSISR